MLSMTYAACQRLFAVVFFVNALRLKISTPSRPRSYDLVGTTSVATTSAQSKISKPTYRVTPFEYFEIQLAAPLALTNFIPRHRLKLQNKRRSSYLTHQWAWTQLKKDVL